MKRARPAFRSPSFRTKLLLLVVLTSLVPLVGLTAFGLTTLSAQLWGQHREVIVAKTQEAARLLQVIQQDLSREAQALAQKPEIMGASFPGGERLLPGELAREFVILRERWPLTFLEVTNREGQPVARFPALSEIRSPVPSGDRHPGIRGSRIELVEDEPTVVARAPIVVRGGIGGSVVLGSRLVTLLEERVKPVVGVEVALYWGGVPVASTLGTVAVAELATIPGGLLLPDRGEPPSLVLFGTTPFTPAGLPLLGRNREPVGTLLFLFPQGPVRGAQAQIQSWAAVVLGGTAALLLGLALVLSRRLCRPLDRLVAGARGVGDRRLPTRAALPHEDEMGLVAGSFTEMADSIERLERDLEGRNRELAIVHALSLALGRSHDPTEILSKGLEHVLQILHLPAGDIHEAFWDEGRLRLRVSQGLPSGVSAALQEMPMEGTYTGKAARDGKTVVVRDLALAPPVWPSLREAVLKEGYRGMACVPIPAGGGVWGVLAVLGKEPQAFSPEQIQVLEAVSRQLGIAFERALLVSDLKEANSRLQALFDGAEADRHRLETLTRVVRSVSTTLHPLEVFQAVVDAVVSLFPGNACRLWTVEGELVVLRAEAGVHGLMGKKTAFAFGEGLAGAVVATREPLIVMDVHQDARTVNREWMEHQGFVSCIGLPFLVGEEIEGVLALFTRAAHHFASEEVALLESLASQAAIAIKNARLFEETQRRARELSTLHEIGTALVSTLDLLTVLEAIASSAVTLIGAHRGAVFELDPRDQRLHVRTTRGMRPDQPFMPIKLGQGAAGSAALLRRPVFSPDVHHQPLPMYDELWEETGMTLGEVVRQRGYRAILAVPLVSKETVLGAICIYWDEVHPYDEGEVRLLTALAQQAAVAIENARLFQETRDKGERLELLTRLVQTMTATLDERQVYQFAVDSAVALLGGEEQVLARLWKLEPSGRELTRLAEGGVRLARDVSPRSLVIGEGLVGSAAALRRPLVVDRIENDPRAGDSRWVRDEKLVSFAGFPLLLGERLVGVLDVSTRSPHHFTPEEIRVFTSFADQAAIALENARLLNETRKHAGRVETLVQVNQAMSASLRVDPILETIRQAAIRLFNAFRVAVWISDEERQILTEWAPEPHDPLLPPRAQCRFGEGGVGWVAEHRGPILFASLATDDRLSPADRAHGQDFSTFTGVPIQLREKLLGVLSFTTAPPCQAQPEDQALLDSLAGQAAIALDNAQLFEEAQRRARELQGLIRAGRTLSSSLEQREVLETVVREAANVMGVGSCSLRLIGSDRGHLRWMADVGVPAEWREETQGGLTGRVAAEGRPLAVLDPVTHPSTRRPDFWRNHGFASYLGVPVNEGDQTIGVLSFYTREPRQFSETEIALALSFADQAAIALKNARLFEEVVRRSRELSALYAVVSAAGQSLDLTEILERALERAIEVLGADGGQIFLVEGEEVTPATTRDLPEEFVTMTGRLKITEGLVGEAIERGEPIWFEDLATDPEYLRISSRRVSLTLGFRAQILVPILLSGAPIGILSLLHRAPHRFSTEEVQLLSAIAQQLAVAINNGRLFQETQRAYRELTATQEQLIQSEKLRALGEMASGVAHDFNNLLAAILGRTQLLLRRIDAPDLRRWLMVIEQVALDGAQTVRRIQEFTRVRRDQSFTPVDVVQLIRDALEVTQLRWRDEAQARGVEIRVEIDFTPVPPVPGNPAELREVLTNLILNSVDAMPAGGTLRLSTRADDRGVIVQVRDTGAGMPDDVRRRVFEPFFTTKGPRGTGLGLAVAYGIVTRHGGEIQVESREGIGSTFTLRLPYGRIETSPEPAREPAGLTGARILVIDDEESVLEALRDLLSLRHVVEVATTGADGIERFRQARFDMVVTDLGMPGMSGWQVAQAIKTLRPETPVVIVTGWGVELDPAELKARGVERVLTKPFNVEEVFQMVDSLLNSKRSGGEAGEGR